MAVTNSLKVEAVIKHIIVFCESINMNLQTEKKFFLSPDISQKFGFTYSQRKTLTSPSEGLWLAPDISQKFGFTYSQRKTLTSPSEGLWLANPSLLWLSYLLLQDSPTTFKSTAPEIFSSLISEELSFSVVVDYNLIFYYFISIYKKLTCQ